MFNKEFETSLILWFNLSLKLEKNKIWKIFFVVILCTCGPAHIETIYAYLGCVDRLGPHQRLVHLSLVWPMHSRMVCKIDLACPCGSSCIVLFDMHYWLWFCRLLTWFFCMTCSPQKRENSKVVPWFLPDYKWLLKFLF